MADILNWSIFLNGVEKTDRLYVGHDSNGNSVIRYKFRAPAAGARSLSWVQSRSNETYGTPVTDGEKLRFYITEDPTSHINAGPGAVYHGEATATRQGSYIAVSGSVSELMLLPERDYYLFIFPGFSTYGLYDWDWPTTYMTISLEGSAGVVRIREGDQELTAIPMVKECDKLITLSATVKIGSELKYCS